MKGGAPEIAALVSGRGRSDKNTIGTVSGRLRVEGEEGIEND